MAWDIGAFEYVSAGLSKSDLAETSVQVTDSVSPRIDNWLVSVAETAVTITDSAVGALGSWHRSVAETAVTVTDAGSPALAHATSVAESAVTVTDSVSSTRLKAWYQANELVIIAGADPAISGTVESTWWDDGTNLELGEATGTPGFTFDFIFTNVPSAGAAQAIHFRGYYSGNVGHRVKLQQYNYTTTTYTDLTADTGDLPHDTAEYFREFPIFTAADYFSSGAMRFRITHTSAGSGSHVLYIDEFTLSPDPAVNLAETAVTVTDAVSPRIDNWLVSVAETAVTVTDAVSDTSLVDLGGDLTQTVAESAVNVTDTAVGALGSWHQTVTETAVTVTDTPTGALGSWHRSVAETAVTVTDSVSDTYLVDEAALTATAAESPVTVTDAVQPKLSWRPISVTDVVSGTELVDIAGPLTATVAESPIGITEVIRTYGLYRPITVTDTAVGALAGSDTELVGTATETAVTVTDTAQGSLGYALTTSVSDPISVTEVTDWDNWEPIFVTDTAVGLLSSYVLTLSETAVTVTDSVSPALALVVAVAETAVTITDSITPSPIIPVTIQLTRSELIGVTDTTIGALSPWFATVTDSATVTDTAIGAFGLATTVPEAMTVTDQATGILLIPLPSEVWVIAKENRTHIVPWEHRIWVVPKRPEMEIA